MTLKAHQHRSNIISPMECSDMTSYTRKTVTHNYALFPSWGEDFSRGSDPEIVNTKANIIREWLQIYMYISEKSGKAHTYLKPVKMFSLLFLSKP
jgi:hypothetical protein